MMRFLSLLILVMATGASYGSDLTLFTWKAAPNLPPLILAVRSGETPAQAAVRYVESLRDNPDFAELLKASPLPNLDMVHFAPLSDADFGRRTLLIANRPEDYRSISEDPREPESNHNWRIASFRNPFTQFHVVPYIVPFSADAGLTAEESRQLIQQLNLRFPPFLAMGGDDLDLTPFGMSNERSIRVQAARDRFEYELLKIKIETIRNQSVTWLPDSLRGAKREDRLAGICRGSQFSSLFFHQGFNPELAKNGRPNEAILGGEGGQSTPSATREKLPEPVHPLTVFETQFNRTAQVVKGFKGPLVVNDYHRQATVFKPGFGLELAAINPENGGVEALEGENVWLLQFHPELMVARNRGEVRELGMRFMKALAQFLTPLSCENLLMPNGYIAH